MKDGIYRITLNVDGQDVIAEAQIRNGIFQGLGDLAGIVGVFATGTPQAPALPIAEIAESGSSNGHHWQREPLTRATTRLPWLAIDDTESDSEARFAAWATDLQRVCEEVGAIQRRARHHVARSAAQMARAARAGLWTFGEWDDWDDEGPLRMT